MNKTQTARFESWYKYFPKKASRGDGEKAWETLDPDEELAKKMTLAIQAQIRFRAIEKKNGQWQDKFWKAAGPWIRQKCWLDEIGSTVELREKAEARICSVEGCTEAVHAPKGLPLCYHHLSYDSAGRLRSGCILVPEIRQHYQDHPELHNLRGDAALKFCRAKIRGMIT